jgi:hypothetical protein|tara:strand:+ start:771 stop:1631 length:861 start_codon:yes stop_codon:yes gene_type:complete
MAVLSSTARAAIISEAKSKFGPNFPDTLLSIYIDAYIDTGNDATEAGNVMRQSTEYAQAFPGNLNPDGVSVKYTESEYLQIVDSYKRKIESLGVNSDLIVTTERIQTLIENVVSPQEFGERVQSVYQNVLTALPQVKEYYQLNFGQELTDAEIIASAIDPNISQQLATGAIDASSVVSQNIVRGQIGGLAAAEGVDITLTQAESLRQQGLTARDARQSFRQATEIQSLAQQQGRTTEVVDIVSGLSGDTAEQKRIERILGQQAGLSSAQTGAVRTQTGQYTGLEEI